jgi:hypothetical protein
MVPVTGMLRGDAPMILTVFELIAMLAVLGIAFVLGRMWEVRQQETRRDHEGWDGFRIPAHSPALASANRAN